MTTYKKAFRGLISALCLLTATFSETQIPESTISGILPAQAKSSTWSENALHELEYAAITKQLSIHTILPELGYRGMLHLASGTVSKDIIIARQTIIKALCRDNAIATSIRTGLSDLCSESTKTSHLEKAFAYLDSRNQLYNKARDFYFQIPLLSSVNKALNNSPKALNTASTAFIVQSTLGLLAATGLSGGIQNLIWQVGAQQCATGKDAAIAFGKGIINPFQSLADPRISSDYSARPSISTMYTLGDRADLIQAFFKEYTNFPTAQVGGWAGALAISGLRSYGLYIQVRDTYRALDLMIADTGYIHDHLKSVRALVDAYKNILIHLETALPATHVLIKSLRAELTGELLETTAEESAHTDILKAIESSAFVTDALTAGNYGQILYTHKLICKYPDFIRRIAQKLALIDALQALASVYAQHKDTDTPFCFVEFADETQPTLDLSEFWHPLTVKSAVTSDIHIPVGTRMVVITGPNGIGKTTFAKALGLIAGPLATGGIVPARHARITLPDAHLIHLHAPSSVEKGTSAFMAELRAMNEVNKVLHNTGGKRTLCLLDEPLRSTVPAEAEAQLKLAAQGLLDTPSCLTIMTTNLHDITTLEAEFPGAFVNYHVNVEESPDGFERRGLEKGANNWWFTDQAKRGRFVEWLKHRVGA